MKDVTNAATNGSDWTRLLTDLDLVSHLGPLLQTYRQVPPEQREATLLQAMREIKEEAARNREAKTTTQTEALGEEASNSNEEPELAGPEPTTEMPPFEPPSIPSAPPDRRRHRRTKCFVAVEINVEDTSTPVWGNLANVSRGGCLVETAHPVSAGKQLQIGLWISSGKLWVKGVILSGIVTQSSPSFRVRVRFSETELSEKKHLREFLKFIKKSTRKTNSGTAYITRLKA
jgi:hypothetical protein